MKRLQLFTLFTALLSSSCAWAFPARFSVSPDNSQALLLETLAKARTSIVLNVYMITSAKLQDLLIEKMRQNISVQILVEAEPNSEGIIPSEKAVLDTLSAAIHDSGDKTNKLLVMSSKHGSVQRRYTYDHAKYFVIDGKLNYISSENFVGSGAMANPRYRANRGWQVAFENTAIARELLQIFAQDTGADNADVAPYSAAIVKIAAATPQNASAQGSSDNSRTVAPLAGGAGNVTSASLCASPQSLSCIKDFIGAAKTSLSMEHLSLPLYWMQNGKQVLNPILQAAIDAAKRGVTVRILLDASANAGPAAKADGFGNSDTVAYVKKIAGAQHLPIEAAQINTGALQLTLLHNKGMVADGKRAFISSINGTRNSVENNREIAVSLDSIEAALYYGNVFNTDWAASASTH